MSTKEVYDYVMHTPKNTNPAVLSSMLGHLSWNDLKDKPFYAETVQKSKTLEFVTPMLEFDPATKFSEQLYAQRKTASYTVHGVKGVFKEDSITAEGMPPADCWDVECENGDIVVVALLKDSTVGRYNGQIFFVDTSSITFTYEAEEVHKLDAKYLPSAIPKKLSDLENDLWYSKKERFLTLTKEDFIPQYILDDNDEPTEEIEHYYYKGTPKLDWLKNVNCFDFELAIAGAPEPFTKANTGNWTREEIVEIGAFVLYSDFFLELLSGLNPVEQRPEDAFFINIFMPKEAMETVTSLVIYKVDEKKIPIEYCDTSEIEDEIYSLADEVENL